MLRPILFAGLLLLASCLSTLAQLQLQTANELLLSCEVLERGLKLSGNNTVAVHPIRKRLYVGAFYRIIERPRVLAFTWLPSWDEEATETLVRFDLDEQDGVTRVRLTHSGFATEGSRARHQGWPQILGWLKSYAEG